MRTSCYVHTLIDLSNNNYPEPPDAHTYQNSRHTAYQRLALPTTPNVLFNLTISLRLEVQIRSHVLLLVAAAICGASGWTQSCTRWWASAGLRSTRWWPSRARHLGAPLPARAAGRRAHSTIKPLLSTVAEYPRADYNCAALDNCAFVLPIIGEVSL